MKSSFAHRAREFNDGCVSSAEAFPARLKPAGILLNACWMFPTIHCSVVRYSLIMFYLCFTGSGSRLFKYCL